MNVSESDIEELTNAYLEAVGGTREEARKWVYQQYEEADIKSKNGPEKDDEELIRLLEGRELREYDGKVVMAGEDGQWYQLVRTGEDEKESGRESAEMEVDEAETSQNDDETVLEPFSARKIEILEKELEIMYRDGMLDDPLFDDILKEFEKNGVKIPKNDSLGYDGDEESEEDEEEEEESDNEMESDDEDGYSEGEEESIDDPESSSSESEESDEEEEEEEMEVTEDPDEMENEEETKRQLRNMNNPYFRDLAKADRKRDRKLFEDEERPRTEESEEYKTKNELLRKRYNELLVSSLRLKNRVLQVRKEVSYSKRFRRCLVQRLTSHSDAFSAISLEIPSEPVRRCRESDSPEIVDSSSDDQQEEYHTENVREVPREVRFQAPPERPIPFEMRRVVRMEKVPMHKFAVPFPPKKIRRVYSSPIGKK